MRDLQTASLRLHPIVQTTLRPQVSTQAWWTYNALSHQDGNGVHWREGGQGSGFPH